MIDITKPIHYYLFPFNLQEKNITIHTRGRISDINILKKEFNLRFIEDKVPNEHSYIFYAEGGDKCLLFLKEMVGAWLIKHWNITQIDNIYSINELSRLMNSISNE